MAKKVDPNRILKITRHPKRKIIASAVCAFLAINIMSQGVEGSLLSALILLVIASGILVSFLRDRLFIRAQSEADIQRAEETISEEKNKEVRREQASKDIKSEIKNGNDLWGKALVTHNFGWGSVTIYSNGYIYSATRMDSPEKLLAITSNTTMMNANPHSDFVVGGAMLSVQTESRVFTIKETTNSKSMVFTPGDLKRLQELVMVGNSVIS